MKPCKSFRLAGSFTFIGLIGLAITIAINLVALHLFKRASAEYFSDKWWSDWFPSYIIWLVFTIIGFASCCRQKSVDKKHDT